MRTLIQRVTQATVTVEEKVVGEIGPGLVVLVGVTHTDTPREAKWLAEKIANLRVFEDAAGKMNLSAHDIGAEMLVVSQFTLYADTSGGRRPSFISAARPETAEPLIEKFCDELVALGLRVATGKFQTNMLVKIFNAGPVTMQIDSPGVNLSDSQ